jgi:NitT/TauT family transport system ATP-binding protein
MTGTPIHCGYLPLVDCAPLIIAKELNFAAQEGLNLILSKQPSWSALRDRLAFGQIDVAHVLSPMPLAMSLGLSGAQVDIDAMMVLSVNGTVIGVSKDLATQMQGNGWTNTFDNPVETAQAAITADLPKLRIGVPFPFSMHRLLVDYWLTQDPTFDPHKVEIITIPPPHMADAVRDGRVDMFCVGEPWGTVAVQQSDATLVLPGSSIWKFAPEKVLGARRDWIEQNPQTSTALIRAIYKATTWLHRSENMPLAAEILARSHHLDLPDHAIDPALTGRIATHVSAAPTRSKRFLNFHGQSANFPWRSQACWIVDRLAQWHDLDAQTAHQIARDSFRSDLYRRALSHVGVDMPGASEKVEGAMKHMTAVASTKGQMILGPDTFFDGKLFDFCANDVPNK